MSETEEICRLRIDNARLRDEAARRRFLAHPGQDELGYWRGLGAGVVLGLMIAHLMGRILL